MGPGLRIYVVHRDERVSFEKVTPAAPVRLGRDPLNDVVLAYPFVSKFHAVVDVQGGAYVLRDLGSRNGTWLRGGAERVPENQTVVLTPHGNQFSIGPLVLTVESADLRSAPSAHDDAEGPRSAITGQALLTAGAAEEGLARGPALAEELRSHYEAYRREWGRFLGALGESLASLPLERRAEALRSFATQFAGVADEPELQRLAEQHGVALPGRREEARALAVVRELADWYLGRSVTTEAEIVGFSRKLRAALDAFLLTFVPLRNGLRQSQSDLVGIGAAARSALESAATAAEVAALLLDWRNPADEARAVQRMFGDIMVHQVGLVSGVVKGVAALLDKLAPEAIEAEVERKRGFAFGPWRARALWDEFRRRHADYEEEPFSVVFGAEFEKTYRQLFDDAPRATEGALRRPGESAISVGGARRAKVGPHGTMMVGGKGTRP